MDSIARRHLERLSREIARADVELAILRDRLREEAQELEDSHLRMLIAETPQADGDLHRVAGSVDRVRSRIAAVRSELEALRREEASLIGAP